MDRSRSGAAFCRRRGLRLTGLVPACLALRWGASDADASAFASFDSGRAPSPIKGEGKGGGRSGAGRVPVKTGEGAFGAAGASTIGLPAVSGSEDLKVPMAIVPTSTRSASASPPR